MKTIELCPCGSSKSFDDCCNRYINGSAYAPTPEALMRSRYSAYTKANIPYIQETMCGQASQGYDPDDARKWAKSADWTGLTILNTFKKNNDIGYVEFIAYYRIDHTAHQLHECSEFHYIKGRWYYVAGKVFKN